MDIFRDMPVPVPEPNKTLPGRRKLQQLWDDNDNIIQVFQLQSDAKGINGVAVRKPPELSDDQAGFAEYAMDEDGWHAAGCCLKEGKILRIPVIR